MRPSLSLRVLAILAATLACLLPSSGCGGGKKKKGGGLTIAQRLERARAEKTPENQARELVKVARIQFKSQDRSGAAKTLGEARQLIPEDGDPSVRGPRLVEVATLFAEMGEKPPARDVVGKAIAAAGAVEDPVAKATLLAEAAAVQGSKSAGLGDPASARRTLAEARTVAESVEERFRAKALAAVATGCLAAGLIDEAGDLVAKLEESARALEDARPKVEALVAAANVHAQRGDADAAKTLLGEAATEAKAIGGHENRAYALVSVAVAMSGAGDRKGALALLKEAEKSANKVGDADAQKNAAEKVRSAQADVEKKK
ncbi:MAG: hypothetical protein ACKOZU_09950 [Planctomycetaceae bacterium]